jgi:hypothetical protein
MKQLPEAATASPSFASTPPSLSEISAFQPHRLAALALYVGNRICVGMMFSSGFALTPRAAGLAPAESIATEPKAA